MNYFYNGIFFGLGISDDARNLSRTFTANYIVFYQVLERFFCATLGATLRMLGFKLFITLNWTPASISI